MKTGVKYLGTFSDYSGYGSANRAFITSLYVVGVDITTELVVQVPEQTSHGWSGELAKNLQERDIPYKIKIIHLTPDMYPRYMEDGKYHIGHLFWETNKLPKEWIDPCNKMGEIWTSSEAMAQLFRTSGVQVPIYAFPQPVDIAEADKDYGKYSLPKHKGYLFYGMFQWIERKNPKKLVKLFWKTFEGFEDVSLLLKTYRVSYAKEEYDQIQIDIRQWKREQPQRHYPRIYVTNKLFSHHDIMKIHTTGDCFVSADHGEGWNRCLHEALLLGKPAISTARGGIHEYLNSSYYFPVESEYVQVSEVSWIPYYRADQQWAEVDEKKFMDTMRYVFANRELAQLKGIQAKDYIKNKFSYQKVGLLMRERLERIERGL